MKLKVLELFDDLKIKVSEDGKIYTFDHNIIRKRAIGLIQVGSVIRYYQKN